MTDHLLPITVDGITATVEIRFTPQSLFVAASVELLSVQRNDDEVTTSSEWDRKAEALILARHGLRLQEMAAEAEFERMTGANV